MPPPPPGGGKDSHIKVTGGLSHLLVVTIHGLVLLRVIKSKTTSVRGMVVPFRALS